MNLVKVISGFQIGADFGGVCAAIDCGLKTGGWMPRGFKTIRGDKPEYARLYGARETFESDYPTRTGMNVLSSHGTLRFAYDFNSRGEVCTLARLKFYEKPYFDVDLSKGQHVVTSTIPRVIKFITDNNIKILNVAGNATEATEKATYDFMMKIFEELKS